MAAALNRTSTLLAYFELNENDHAARQFTHTQIPSHYVYKHHKENSNKVFKWFEQKSQFNCIGRMYSVSRSQVELFRLRLLLLHCKGATSFDDLKNVNGVQYQTFSEVCLIEDDEEWCRAMQEAVSWIMPYNLRQLFVRILIHWQPIHPDQLWENFKDALSEDFIHLYHNSIRAQNLAYSSICQILTNPGHSIADFPVMPQDVVNNYNESCDEININFANVANEQYYQLNFDQKEIVDIVLQVSNIIDYNGFKCFYIDGPGGSGKTFFYRTLYNLLKSQNKKICCMAFTGIAATLLPNGKTVHKVLGLPLLSDSSSNFSVQ